ncbi:hypothetical protein ACFW3Z_24380 [Nocardiopsis alba]|uniref:hypothetical protein n=1 Tax=Nocardiopsis alba TaxID=53437 RepID=UPI00366D20BD
MSVAGEWDLTIRTPIGRIGPTVRIVEEEDGLSGIAWSEGEEPDELIDLALDGDRLTWRQSVRRPLRLDLVFDLTLDGDTMTGTSKAGRLPASKVVARRSASPGRS